MALLSTRQAEPRAALAVAGLTAAALGALGMPAGLLWVVTGVWAVRVASGGPIDAAWGIAVIGAAMRWGTLSLGDLSVATRVAGPTVLAGPVHVRAAMVLALGAAIAGEIHLCSSGAGLRGTTWASRAAAMGALAVLVPVFCVRGPSEPADLTTLWWPAIAAGLAAVVLLTARFAGRMPAWAPAVAAMLGVAISLGGA